MINTLQQLFRKELEEYENDRDDLTGSLQYLFQNQTNLKKVSLPNRTGAIGLYAFSGCTNLQEVDLSNTMGSIGDNAFYCCRGLTKFDAPNVTSIGGTAFAACGALKNYDFYFPYVTTINDRAFQSYMSLDGKYGHYGATGTLTVPSIQTLSGFTLRETAITQFDFGPRLVNIPTYCFYNGYDVTLAILRSTVVVAASDSNSIKAIKSTTKVYVPSALIDSYKAANYWSAKGDIFYPIEGSEYEHYYANGVHVSDISFITKNVTFSNTTPWVPYENPYSTTLSVDIGFEYQTFSITMGGVDITSSVYNAETGEVNIPHVTDAVLIKAIATPIEYDWDYEWDYTDGLLTDNGWTQGNWNTGGVATMTENGLELTSANNSNISFRHTDYLVTSGIMEVTLSATFGTGAYVNANVCLSNGTNGVSFISPKGNGGIRNVSGVGSCTTFGALPSGTDFTVRLALDGTSGNIAINDIVKWRTDNIPGNSYGTWVASTRVCSESQQSGYSTIVKSIRIKRLDQGGES